MSKLAWDAAGERLYEIGVEQVALYPVLDNGNYGVGVAWNGVTSINENPSGGDENALYADNIKYLALRGAEDFGGTIEAYMYPDEWKACDGTKTIAKGAVAGQQNRRPFGLAYKTKLGNDAKLDDYGYKIHLIYGATASPSEKSYQTKTESPDAVTFSWEFTTVPVPVGSGFNPTSLIVIDSTKCDADKLKALEAMLFGKDGEGAGNEPTLPLPAKVIELLGAEAAA